MRGRLTLRYWVTTAGLVTCFLALGGFVEIVAAFRENSQRISSAQHLRASTVRDRIDDRLKNVRRWMRDTASLPWRKDALGPDHAEKEFYRLLKVVPDIQEVRGYDARGRQVLQVSMRNTDEMTQAAVLPQGGDGFGTISFRNGSVPFTTLAVPVSLRDATLGRIEADLHLGFIGDAIRSAAKGDSLHAYVLDRDNQLIAHSTPGLELKRLHLGTLAHIAALREQPGAGGVAGIKSRDLDGHLVLASGVPLSEAPWVVFVEEPFERATEDAWATVQRTTVLVCAGLMAAVLVSLFMARRLSRPIEDLRRGTERIAHGDLAARVGTKTGDELDDLAADFNLMAEQLQDHTMGLERKVEEKTAALQQAMRARALFLAAASHDLRQPLYAIALLSERLVDAGLAPAAADALQRQQRAIGLLRTQFENLLDLSRLEAGELRPVHRTVFLREVLEPIDAEYRTLCESRGLAWRFDVPAAVRVRTDPEMMLRMVANLLSNAVRYTAEGEVALEARGEADKVRVTISDTGVGIQRSDQQRIFEEFVRLQDTTALRDKGVGLGLAIVKRIAVLLDAALSLESQPGKGTRVTFEMPAVRDAPA